MQAALASHDTLTDDSKSIVGAAVVAKDSAELTELDQLREQFITLASHELKTPISIIKGYAQLLLKISMDVPARERGIINAIADGAERIHIIVNDLLDVSQLRAGNLTLAKEPIVLSELVEITVHHVSLTTTGHRVVTTRADGAVVNGDRYRLEQVLVNLLENAITYSPEGGDVVVEVTVADQEAVLSVKDSGVGIPKHKQHHICERFYRAHAGTPHDYGGIGLGLHISNEIVRRHGGRMWFESEEGKGSIFSFSLPLAECCSAT